MSVEVRREADGAHQLMRNGEPYFINGAGGSSHLELLAASGGNSIRTWSTRNGAEVLDAAHRHGLTVAMGLGVARQRHGFDYDDEEAVAGQLEQMRVEVLKYRDHPALLVWGIGNELNLNYSNPRVWDAVEGIAAMIHEVDPNHPTMTVLAGVTEKEVQLLRERAPSMDILGINTYGGLPGLPAKVREFGWEGPYLIGEWGPTGHWEVPKTEWGAPIEENSGEKAAVYRERYERFIAAAQGQCLGTYAFLWGQKQERTPTWYGMFLESGEATEVVDVMQFLWTGAWPENRVPHLEALRVDGKGALESIYLEPGAVCRAAAKVEDPDGDPLTLRWEFLPESTDLGTGGDRESRPEPLSGLIVEEEGKEISFRAPEMEGAYRLFVYALDGREHAGTANVPFYVRR